MRNNSQNDVVTVQGNSTISTQTVGNNNSNQKPFDVVMNEEFGKYQSKGFSRTKDDIREEIVQTQRWIREWCDWTYQYKSGIEKIKRLKNLD